MEFQKFNVFLVLTCIMARPYTQRLIGSNSGKLILMTRVGSKLADSELWEVDETIRKITFIKRSKLRCTCTTHDYCTMALRLTSHFLPTFLRLPCWSQNVEVRLVTCGCSRIFKERTLAAGTGKNMKHGHVTIIETWCARSSVDVKLKNISKMWRLKPG